jgi:quercetin dioxygenase-like cupin family protein
MHSIHVQPTEGARFHVTGDLMRVLASAEQTGDAYEMFVMEAVQGSGPPPHAHPWSEAYLVLEGEAEVFVDGAHSIASTGCFFQIPAGTVHAHRVRSKSAKFVVVTSPRGARNFFEEAHDETDFEKVVGIAIKHGFTVPSPAGA